MPEPMKSITDSQPAEASPTPVTYVVVWRVKEGKVREFENLLHNLMTAAATFPGHQGVHVVKPAEGQPAVYRVVARFDSDAGFQAWRESAVCRHLVSDGGPRSSNEQTDSGGPLRTGGLVSRSSGPQRNAGTLQDRRPHVGRALSAHAVVSLVVPGLWCCLFTVGTNRNHDGV